MSDKKLWEQYVALEKERDALRSLVVMRFDHDHPPQFTQGYDTHELTEPVTAEHCRWFVAEIERLSAEVAHIKEVEFPRKAQAVADAWKGKCKRLEVERDALHAKIARMERQEPVMWANSSNITSSRINRERGGCGDQHTCSETQTAYHDTQLYALPGAQPAPSVPEGWTLVPIEPTPTMVKAGLDSSHVLNVHRVLVCYDAMIDAAPEAKP